MNNDANTTPAPGTTPHGGTVATVTATPKETETVTKVLVGGTATTTGVPNSVGRSDARLGGLSAFGVAIGTLAVWSYMQWRL